MHGTLRRAALAAGFLLLLPGSVLRAQEHQHHKIHQHMSLTELRPGSPDDTTRALAVVRQLRSAIEPYQTLEAAAAAGYHPRRDSTMLPEGKLLHAGKRQGRRAAGTLDPSAPQALLYRRLEDGSLRLAGAMFVAPPQSTVADLDALIPLSVAHWHQHRNVCVAPGPERRVLRRVTTADGCETAGGRFRAESRYMIHVMTDAGDDVAGAFPQGREG